MAGDAHLVLEGEVRLIDVAGHDMRQHLRPAPPHNRPARSSGRGAPAQAPAGSGSRLPHPPPPARRTGRTRARAGSGVRAKRRQLLLQRIAGFVGEEAGGVAVAQALEAGADLVMVARLDDAERPRIEQGAAARPGVVEQDEGAAQPCHALPVRRMAARQESKLGLQHLRPVQDRRRSFVVAHDGTDDGRLHLCREAARGRAARAGGAGRRSISTARWR